MAILAKYQRQYTAHKLIVSRSNGTLIFDGQRDRGKDVNLFTEMFGSESADSKLKFEMLMDSIPATLLTRIPESRLDSPFVVAFTEAGLRYLTERNLHSASQIVQSPSIEICSERRAPYEVSDVQHSHVLSTVRIGLRNSGGGTLSNCKVYVEKIAPDPQIRGGFPALLYGEGFNLRHDDPEKLVDVATCWDHVGKFRFNMPVSGNFFDALSYIDDSISRTIVIKASATECQRMASFKLWVDDSKAIHLEFISYVS
jgi:hypothetical protein